MVVMVPQMGENKGKIGVLRGNQGRSAGATTREGGGVPVGNAGAVLRARGGRRRAGKRLGGEPGPRFRYHIKFF